MKEGLKLFNKCKSLMVFFFFVIVTLSIFFCSWFLIKKNKLAFSKYLNYKIKNYKIKPEKKY